jgi:hypothetical protein
VKQVNDGDVLPKIQAKVVGRLTKIEVADRPEIVDLKAGLTRTLK